MAGDESAEGTSSHGHELSAKATEFIKTHLRLEAVPGLSDIVLYAAHSGSGLGNHLGGRQAPYWAYPWAGGLALARHIARLPQVVAGKTVVDIGSGSGLVAIAAARAGAASVLAIEDDIYGAAATGLNAAANGAAVEVIQADATAMELSSADIVLAGDVFYSREVAEVMAPLLARLAGRGMEVLVGDPGRRYLPLELMTRMAEYEVRDMGGGSWMSRVYAFSDRPVHRG